ncbi:hypothetical protein D3OALGA1CA_1174 [Olavius algarvensis associated proteobacterium Delta 3]|nr:hypothetical protein D3OALGA1CA_1174 [Olavius algarvensis associated proteobacterium Delta 3]
MSLPLKFELLGIIFIFFAGSAFHFIYEWSGYRKIVALFGAVHESTWEHLKLAFWPDLLVALKEYPSIGDKMNNFWVGKSIGLFAMPVLIVMIFYSYTAIFPHMRFCLKILGLTSMEYRYEFIHLKTLLQKMGISILCVHLLNPHSI